MNWYKQIKAQQLGLWGQDPSTDPLADRTPKPLFDPNSIPDEDTRFTGDLLDDIEYWQGDYIELFDHYEIDPDVVETPSGSLTLFNYNGSRYVLGDQSVSEVNEWINDVSDPSDYINYRDFNEEFWSEIGNGVFTYHATDPDNVDSILEVGINASSETRGMSNKNTGDAVFTSTNIDAIDPYGSAVFAIDLGAMAKDGYKPSVSLEEPIQEHGMYEALAHKLGIDNYNRDIESGMDFDTIVIYGHIPPKYIKRVR